MLYRSIDLQNEFFLSYLDKKVLKDEVQKLLQYTYSPH